MLFLDQVISVTFSYHVYFGHPPFQVYVLNPKQDFHGLGYDPFEHAPEFRGE